MAVFSINKDGIPHAFLALDEDRNTAAQDILSFIHGLTGLLLTEKSALEASSRMMGKTNEHAFGFIDSVDLSKTQTIDVETGIQLAASSNDAVIFAPQNEAQLVHQAKPKSLESKIYAANCVAVLGVSAVGHTTLRSLMWPLETFTYAAAASEAFSLLGDVHTELLKGMPRQQSDQILKAQAERLF